MPLHDWTKIYSGMFHDFHQSWSIRIKDALNCGILPKGALALVEHKAGPVEADVLTIDLLGEAGGDWAQRGGAVTAVEPVARFVQKSTKVRYAERANRIVVQQPVGHTIAVVEIVSPGNKDSKRAFKTFVEKSQDYIARGVHLLVVDPFPPTKRDPEGVHRVIWDDFEDAGREFAFPVGKDRLAVSYDSNEVEKAAYVEAFAVGDVLPEMPLFLGGGYHVVVPLEDAYLKTWAVMPAEYQEIVVTGLLPGGRR